MESSNQEAKSSNQRVFQIAVHAKSDLKLCMQIFMVKYQEINDIKLINPGHRWFYRSYESD